MKKTIRQPIEELAAMDVAAPQTRHLESFGRETTCAHRQLVWHLQARIEGGLPESAIELARSIAWDTPLRTRADEHGPAAGRHADEQLIDDHYRAGA